SLRILTQSGLRARLLIRGQALPHVRLQGCACLGADVQAARWKLPDLTDHYLDERVIGKALASRRSQSRAPPTGRAQRLNRWPFAAKLGAPKRQGGKSCRSGLRSPRQFFWLPPLLPVGKRTRYGLSIRAPRWCTSIMSGWRRRRSST